MLTVLLIIMISVAAFAGAAVLALRPRPSRGGVHPVCKEEGIYVISLSGKRSMLSVPMSGYERSRSEPVAVPGTAGMCLYRGQVFQELDFALEEMSKRAGKDAVASYRRKTVGSAGREEKVGSAI